MNPGRWTRTLAALLATVALTLPTAGAARAGYQATVDSNTSAFAQNCIGFVNTNPAKLLAAAVAGYRNLGYYTTGFSGTSFTWGQVISRTPADWGYYVHSHGYNSDLGAGTDSSFKEDAGRCSGGTAVLSSQIRAARNGRPSNLVIMSTCYLGDTITTMPAAFGIPKTKARTGAWAGPNFYIGYMGPTWDSDELTFETRFWAAIGPGYGAGQAYDVAKLGAFNSGFSANWYGSYFWTGRAGPLPTCPNCL